MYKNYSRSNNKGLKKYSVIGHTHKLNILNLILSHLVLYASWYASLSTG